MSSNSLHRLKIRKGSQCTSNSYLSTTTLSTQSSDCDQLYRKMKFACTSFECKIKPLSLPIVPIPIPLTPKHLKKTSPEVYLSECQNLLNLLGYNYISEPFFVVNKKAPYRRLQSLAIDMLKFSLPIKCLEAVVLGFYLTRFLKGSIVRIPLAFKSECFGESYRHIVLAIYNLSSKKWGAIGLSRRSDLMDKAFVFEDLEGLILEYRACYLHNSHDLQKVILGFPAPFDSNSGSSVIWKHLLITIQGKDDYEPINRGDLELLKNYCKAIRIGS